MAEQKTNRWHFSPSIVSNPVFPEWELYDNVDNVIAIVTPVRNQYDEAKAFMYMAVEAPAMLEVLQEFEWLLITDDVIEACIWCLADKPKGHRPNCTLDAAIKAATGR